jgi:hypothetical protein
MPYAFLLALQAAGMVVDYFGTQSQANLMKLGGQLQQAGFEANLEQTRLETEDESLQAMKNLRKNLGSQIATYAARGTALGAGSAVANIEESLSNASADERTRRLNLLGKENQLRAGSVMTRLQNMSETSKLWQSFTSRSLSKIPTSPAAFNQFSEGFGLTKFFG